MTEETERVTFSAWITSPDPVLGWPILSWLGFAICLGIVLGVVLA